MKPKSKMPQSFVRISGMGLFFLALFIYFKTVTAPNRWIVWSPKTISQAFQRNVGLEAIRPEAVWMKQIADKRLDKSYRLTGELKTNAYISYPAREYLYPIRIAEEGPMVFSKSGESVSPQCKKIDEQGDVSLYECPNP